MTEILGDIEFGDIGDEVGWNPFSAAEHLATGVVKNVAHGVKKLGVLHTLALPVTLPFRTVAMLPEATVFGLAHLVPGKVGAAIRNKMKQNMKLTANDYKVIAQTTGQLGMTAGTTADQASRM